MRGRQGRDRLTTVVERAIEQHLPGGSLGVDIPSMAHEVVRQVRRQLAVERLQETAARGERLDEVALSRRQEAFTGDRA